MIGTFVIKDKCINVNGVGVGLGGGLEKNDAIVGLNQEEKEIVGLEGQYRDRLDKYMKDNNAEY